MKDKLTPKVVAALGVAAVAAVALIGWFGLVSPQRSKASDLDRQIAEAQTQLVVAKATAQLRPASEASAVGPRARAGDAAGAWRCRTCSGSFCAPRIAPTCASTRSRRRLRPRSRATRRADGRRRHRALLPRPAVPAATCARRRGVVGRQRARLRPAVQRRLGEPRPPVRNELPQLAATIHLNVFTYSGSAAAATSTATPDDRARLFDFELGGCRRRDALMSAIETRMAGRRAAARNAAERRKKLILVGLRSCWWRCSPSSCRSC